MLKKEWKQIMLKAWSMWGIYAMITLTAADAVLRAMETEIDPMLFSIAMVVLGALAGIGRVLNQNVAAFIKDESGAIKRRTVGMVAGSAIALSTATAFVGHWEGLRTTAYRDAVGVWTICYGETRGVRPGDTTTVSECDAMLAARIVEFERNLDECLSADVPIGMKIAMVSWAYNVGSGAACRSTLVRKANAGDLEGACRELPRWNRAGGRVLRGLTNRRLSERAMCLKSLAA